MLTYKKKVIIALLENFDSDISISQFYNLLYSFTNLQQEKTFNFIKRRKHHISYQVFLEKKSLIKKGYLKDTLGWDLVKDENITKKLKEYDQVMMKKLKNDFERYSSIQQDEVVKTESFNDDDGVIIYTIGYEGEDIDQYFNKLVKNHITVLCDVRRNPLSRKAGFSKNSLSKMCSNFNIEYKHFPQLGIESSSRKNLNTYEDYVELFKIYEKGIDEKKWLLDDLLQVIEDNEKVALTCYEKDPNYCHRKVIADKVNKKITDSLVVNI